MRPSTYYQRGFVKVVKGSAIVEGHETKWLTGTSDGTVPVVGCPFTTNRVNYYTIKTIDSDTQLTLSGPYTESTESRTSYLISLSHEIDDDSPAVTEITALVNSARASANDAAESAEVAKEAAESVTGSAELAASHAAAAEVSRIAAAGSAQEAGMSAEESAISAALSEVCAVRAETAQAGAEAAQGVSEAKAAEAAQEAAQALESKVSAEASAKTATEKAQQSVEKAALATAKAEVATDKAAIAVEKAAIATTQAGIATEHGTAAVQAAERAEASESSSLAAKVAAERARDTATAKAAQAADSATKAKASEVAALSSQTEAGESAELAEKWASYPRNAVVVDGGYSAFHWAEEAKHNASLTFISGGLFTPTVGHEYPDVTDIVRDTIWIVNFTEAGSTYTFTAGDLAGQTASAGSMLFYDMPVKSWALIQASVSGVISINGKTGAFVTLVPEDIGALAAGATAVNASKLENLTKGQIVLEARAGFDELQALAQAAHDLAESKVSIDDWYQIKPKTIGNADTAEDVLAERPLGVYVSRMSANQWTNLPEGCWNAFTLEVLGIQGFDSPYRTLRITDMHGRTWTNSQTNHTPPLDWQGWKPYYSAMLPPSWADVGGNEYFEKSGDGIRATTNGFSVGAEGATAFASLNVYRGTGRAIVASEPGGAGARLVFQDRANENKEHSINLRRDPFTIFYGCENDTDAGRFLLARIDARSFLAAKGIQPVDNRYDMNSLTDEGNFTLSGDWLNTPLGDGSQRIAGMVNVSRRLFDAGPKVVQKALFSNVEYHRWATGATGAETWTPWAKLYTTAQKPTAAEIHALSDKPKTINFHREGESSRTGWAGIASDANDKIGIGNQTTGANVVLDEVGNVTYQAKSGKSHIFKNNVLLPIGGSVIIDGKNVLKDYSNGNVVLNAQGAILYLGYEHTTKIYSQMDMYSKNGARLVIDADTGSLYDQGQRVFSASNKPRTADVTGTLIVDMGRI